MKNLRYLTTDWRTDTVQHKQRALTLFTICAEFNVREIDHYEVHEFKSEFVNVEGSYIKVNKCLSSWEILNKSQKGTILPKLRSGFPATILDGNVVSPFVLHNSYI